MFRNCPLCGGEVIKAEKKIGITFPNPGRIFVDTECYECQKCHEKFFDEKQSRIFVEKIEEIKLRKCH